jgi:hypothetical protein
MIWGHMGTLAMGTLGGTRTVPIASKCPHSRAYQCVRHVILRMHCLYFSTVPICPQQLFTSYTRFFAPSTLRTHTHLGTVGTLPKSRHPGIARNRLRINGLIVANDALAMLKCYILNVLQLFCNLVLPMSYDYVSAD